MRTEVLNAFLEKNKVLVNDTDLTKWKFDSYIDVGKKGTNYRKLPMLSKNDEDYNLVLLPTDYWLEKVDDSNYKINSRVKCSKKYRYLLAGSLNYPVYQEILEDE